ncbi:hypothetical protein [Streptacidiphilus cavernicola]|uniref:Transposase n=1 Tax=Streptacidiphilus cavernicola TaxID=3342716 RepID=A0ABV6VNV4_9ACTN
MVRVPDRPAHRRPEICQQPTIGAPVDLMPKLRQRLPWGRAPWELAYRSLRSHIEGLNGRLKGVKSFLHSRERRQSRGRVAQALLAAVQVMVENIHTIESYLRKHRLWLDDECTLVNIMPTFDPYAPTTLPEGTPVPVRPNPERDGPPTDP